MESQKISLDTFIVKGDEELDEQLLGEILYPYLDRILPNGNVEYKNEFFKLSAARKILVEFLVKKLKFAKSVANTKSDCLSSTDLLAQEKKLSLNKESINKSLNRELKTFISKKQEGYYVPNYNLKKSKIYLKNA